MSTDGYSDRNASEIIYLERSNDKSHKFYEIKVNGTEVTIRYGRIGTSGRSYSTTYETTEQAQAEVAKKINEKLRKGYVRVTSKEDVATPSEQPTQGGTSIPTAEADRADRIPSTTPRTTQSREPELPPPSITLLNVAPMAPPRVAKEHLRQKTYPIGFHLRELKYRSMTFSLPRSLICLEMVGTFKNFARSRFTLTLGAGGDTAYRFCFRPEDGQIVQSSGAFGHQIHEERVVIPNHLASNQVFQLVVAIAAKRDFVFYLNNKPFSYTPPYRPTEPIDKGVLNYDTEALHLQLFRVLEPRGADKQKGRSKGAATSAKASTEPSSAFSPTVTETTAKQPDTLEMPEFLRELPPRFEPLRSHLEANLVPYIKFSVTRVGQPTKIDRATDWCDDPLELWQSKIGGHPYLPKGTSYPADSSTGQMMMFLMQIDCGNLPTIEGINLPRQGLLQFYICLNVATGQLSPERHRVLYFPEISKENNDLITDFSFLVETARALQWYQDVYILTFSPHQDVFWDARQHLDAFFEIPEDLREICEDFHEWIFDYEDRCSLEGARGHVNKLGGYPKIHSIVAEIIEGARGRLLLELQHDFCASDNFYFFIEDKDLDDAYFDNIESYFVRY
jgi:uncharacterized protein YwqG/predicted DNA-binding WGR domain protein